ncbi:hypothetical protein V2J09_002110 [Rumex salicifolius]
MLCQELSKVPLSAIPSRFLHDDLELRSVSVDQQLPVISLTSLLRDDDDPSELQKFHDACRNWGFFQVVDHGVSSELIERFKVEKRELSAIFRICLMVVRLRSSPPSSSMVSMSIRKLCIIINSSCKLRTSSSTPYNTWLLQFLELRHCSPFNTPFLPIRQAMQTKLFKPRKLSLRASPARSRDLDVAALSTSNYLLQSRPIAFASSLGRTLSNLKFSFVASMVVSIWTSPWQKRERRQLEPYTGEPTHPNTHVPHLLSFQVRIIHGGVTSLPMNKNNLCKQLPTLFFGETSRFMDEALHIREINYMPMEHLYNQFKTPNLISSHYLSAGFSQQIKQDLLHSPLLRDRHPCYAIKMFLDNLMVEELSSESGFARSAHSHNRHQF